VDIGGGGGGGGGGSGSSGGGGGGSGGGGGGGRGGQLRLLCLARVRVGPLTCRLALRARGPGWQGGGSSTRFAWLALGSGH
jgi:hypothetical protein